jgi:EAL domain-containing protein (putative c-di-GMP-specific phosphodiesterase class I)/ActR/RegA family two-component response regulator
MLRPRIATTGGTMPQPTIIVLSDPTRAEALAIDLASGEIPVVTCHDIASARTVIRRNPPRAVVTEICFDSAFVFEGLALIEEVRESFPEARIIALCGHWSDALAAEARQRGADAVLPSRVDVAALRAALDGGRRAPVPAPGDDCGVVRMPSLGRILESGGLVPMFQPIVDLTDPTAQPYAYESLARFRGDEPSCDCEYMFEYAARSRRVRELDLACATQTLRCGAALTAEARLFMNVHPQLVSGGRDIALSLADTAACAGVRLDRIVMEITEQDKLTDSESAIAFVDTLRARGVEFALDDVGMSYSHLELVDRIRPSFLKVSHHFGAALATDDSKRKIVRNILSLASDFGCEVVVEGIEHAATSEVASAMGARYGQGFLYSKPGDAATFLDGFRPQLH